MEGFDQNAGGVTPLGLLILFFLVVLIWTLPRRLAFVPILLTVCYVPLGQGLVIAGANFPFIRMIILVGWMRVLSRGESRNFIFTKLDRVFVAWLIVTLVIGTFTQPSDFSSRFINRCGEVYSAAGTYFLIRCWLRNVDEFVLLLRASTILIVPLASAMVYERLTSRNLFSVLGGVPEITGSRNGSVRSQGAFSHAILAGTFGATLFPLFIGLWVQKGKKRWKVLVGLICSMTITLTAASSGAVLALMGAVTGLLLWKYRYSMRMIRWGIIAILGALAMVMNAPVWYIFARLSDVAGGTGWYRSFLIEQAVNNFGQWFIAGSLYTKNWAPGGETPPGNPNNTDIINQFVLEGLQGGLLKLILFTTMVVIGFKNVGRFTRLEIPLPFSQGFIIWTLGVCLLTHCLSFFSVTYFDQMSIMWYWTLAALAMLQTAYNTASNLQQNEAAFTVEDVR